MRVHNKVLLIAPAIFLLGGCSASHPIKAWQQRLTNYTMKEGGGDINILRESAELRSTDSLRPAQIRFDHTVDRYEAHGVMIGHHTDDGNPMFFFLLGIVERPRNGHPAKIEDVRLVSCTVREGKYSWTTNDPSPEALDKYLGLTRHDEPTEHMTFNRTFPGTDDDFRFEVRNGYGQAVEVRSGSAWQIRLN